MDDAIAAIATRLKHSLSDVPDADTLHRAFMAFAYAQQGSARAAQTIRPRGQRDFIVERTARKPCRVGRRLPGRNAEEIIGVVS